MKKIIIGIIALMVIIGAYSFLKNDKDSTTLEKKVTGEISKQEENGRKIMEEIDMQGLIEKAQSGEISEEEFEAEMKKSLSQSKTFNSEFEKYKELMPSYLKVAKSYKECISDANSLSAANSCWDSAERMSKSLGLDYEEDTGDEKFTSWTNQDKQRELTELDEGILGIKKSIECYDKTSNMVEAMECMENIQ